MTKAKGVRWPDHAIKATRLPKTLTAFEIDASEQQVRDNRTGPRLKPPRKKGPPPDADLVDRAA